MNPFVVAALVLLVIGAATSPLRGVMLKPNANFSGLTSQILLAVEEARDVYRGHGLELTLTSGREFVERRRTDSKHYDGNAVDLRLPEWPHGPGPLSEEIASEIRERVGAPGRYQLVVKSNHMHLEYDPKRET